MRAVLIADVKDTPGGRRVLFRTAEGATIVKVAGDVPGIVPGDQYAITIARADGGPDPHPPAPPQAPRRVTL